MHTNKWIRGPGLGAAIVGVVTFATTALSNSSAPAQVYPSRPVALVVPFAAGGPSDTVARVLSERMSVSLGQSIVIENVTGGAGSIAVGRVARAAPDGYTLSFGHWSTHVGRPTSQPSMRPACQGSI
jgi:tripartite-type tricarboxylate transporter receptor subunit TctC